MINLVFFPQYKGMLYHDMLYSTFDRSVFKIEPGNIGDARRDLEAGETSVFHIHHINEIFKDAKTEKDAWGACESFIASIDDYLSAGGFLVWTVHNRLSHDAIFPGPEMRLRHYLGVNANLVHLHSHTHTESLKDILSLDPERIVISRHGNWIGAYGEFDFKKRLENISEKKAVFLGQLRPYKGLENLVKAVAALDAYGYETLIAGRPMNNDVRLYIKQHVPARTKLIFKYLTSTELHQVCCEYNIGILSYSSILNSGTLLLYLSYAMNIIRSGDFQADNGSVLAAALTYSADSAGIRNLAAANRSELTDRALANYKLAENENWDKALGESIKNKLYL